MCCISDNPRQYIYFNTSCKPALCMKKFSDLFFFFFQVKNENNKRGL